MVFWGKLPPPLSPLNETLGNSIVKGEGPGDCDESRISNWSNTGSH